MAFKRSIPAPTVAQQKRFDAITQIGCVACLMDVRGYQPCEIHHLNSGGRNIGHDATVGLCPWHHRGMPPNNIGNREAERMFGPSFAHTPRAFRERYGDEKELLEIQNNMLETREHTLNESHVD